MIPKTIHYCWFGGKPKPELVQRCIASWEKFCPDFTIKEWNEENFDVKANAFTALMHKQGHWAFVADYVRLAALLNEGGVYLDTDMLLVQPLDNLLSNKIFLGEEEPGMINVAAMGAEPHHPFIRTCKDFYDTHMTERITIPKVVTNIYNGIEDKNGIIVLPPAAFYPFGPTEIQHYKGQPLGSETYGVHLWNYSWGHPLNKFFKQLGIHTIGKKISEKLGIKEVLKKLLGFV
ncbi:MAG TPA: glycosyltransferase [Candidatus Paceibacterota bacterium]|nr:glycosyltransferase [Candidatus Paceibacterota bacterium]